MMICAVSANKTLEHLVVIMTVLKKHRFKWIAIFILASFAMSGLFRVIYHLDSDKQIVEKLLRNSASLELNIGELKKIRIRKMTSFHGTEAKPPHKDYLYYLEGSKKSAMVKVRHYPDCNIRLDECTSILSIE